MWKAICYCMVILSTLTEFTYSIPDLVKLNGDSESLTEQFGAVVFDVKNNDPADIRCPKTKIGEKNYVNNECAKNLNQFVDVDDFNYFLRPFNKQDSPGAGRVKIHFNGFLSFGTESQNEAGKVKCLKWDQRVVSLSHSKFQSNYLAPYWMRYFEGSVYIFKMDKDHEDRSKIIKDLSEGGFFEQTGSDEENELDKNAQIIVITYVRMASDGTINPDPNKHTFDAKLMNTFQLNLIMRSQTTYAQFYYRSLDTNEIVVENDSERICFGQVGIARHVQFDQIGQNGVGFNVGNFPFGTDSVGYRLKRLPQLAEYHSNEFGDNKDVGSWVYRLSPRQSRQIEEGDDYCDDIKDNRKCYVRQAAIDCLQGEECKPPPEQDGDNELGRSRRSVTAEAFQSETDRFCEYRDDGKFLFPLDCRGYMICRGGKVSFATCDEGEHFHPKLRKCVVESEYSCYNLMPIHKDLKPTDLTTVTVTLNNPKETISTLHKFWTINLVIKPKGIVSTTDTSAFYAVFKNSPTPSILFERGSTKIKVCTTFTYPSPSTCQTIPTPLPLNKFTRVQIQQIPNGADSKFIVRYNGVNQYIGTPTNLQVFNDVKVYPRDPSMAPANAETKYYKFNSGIRPGHVIETLPKLYDTWDLTLSFTPLGAKTGDTNILHATRYFDSHVQGVLKIDFMDGTTRLRICSPSITFGSSNCVRFFRPFEVNKLVTINIQRNRNSFIITVREPQYFVIRFNDPASRLMDDVNVYVSDYWMPSANAVLEAYQFQTPLPIAN
ncbi:uncharacterized protein [Clytia hemisphaerica]|uniref:Chitin-binding type-2 domain-containing protein n=1 Tax=Clytia hemisphaerica TaxID=252671 RepID=A0A7M5WW93_9CNID